MRTPTGQMPIGYTVKTHDGVRLTARNLVLPYGWILTTCP